MKRALPRPTALVQRYVPTIAIDYTMVQNTNSIILQDAPIDRINKVAPMPEETGSQREVYSGMGAPGSSSGKGGHEPKTLGENKGRGAHV